MSLCFMNEEKARTEYHLKCKKKITVLLHVPRLAPVKVKTLRDIIKVQLLLRASFTS